ncbi:MAG: tetratricopeptide repeat protein [Planctomycetota bacterium]
MLAAQKMLQAYVAKGYTQQHPLLQRAQHELDLAMQQLATFDKFLVSEWRTEVHRVEPRFPDNAAEMRPWLLEVLGTTSLEQGDLDRALTLLRQALAATSRPRGDAQALRIQTEIGAVLQRQGRIEEAIALFEQALAQQARVLGEQHPDLLLTSVQLAEARAAAGDLAPAAELLRTTLEKSIAALGEQCPTSQRCLTDLVQVLKALGRTDEANALARRIKRPI